MLYIIAKSPFNTYDLEQCSSIKKSRESKVLLIEDAVIAAKKGVTSQYIMNKFQEDGIIVYALKEDLEARGINDIIEFVESIDYERFVDLIVENKFISCI